MKQQSKKQRGQALVESALVVLAFLVLLIGTLDFAQVLFVHQSLVWRTGAGLRWAAVNPIDQTSIKNVVRFNQTTQPSGAQPFLGLSDSNITVTVYDAGAPTERVQIAIVNYPYYFFTPLIAKSFTNNMAVVETLPTEYRP